MGVLSGTSLLLILDIFQHVQRANMFVVTGLPLLERTRRARCKEDGEEERPIHKGRREGGSEGGQRGSVCGQNTEGFCEDVECCARWVCLKAKVNERGRELTEQ